MSRHNTSSPPVRHLLAPALCGLALSFGPIVVFHRFDAVQLPPVVAAGLAMAVILVGCSIGVRAGVTARRVPPFRWFMLAGALLVWAWWAWAPPVEWAVLALTGVAGTALLAALISGLPGRAPSGFIGGLALGLLACALGLPALLGLPAMAVLCAVGVAAGLLVRSVNGAATEGAAGPELGSALLAAAAGVTGALLLRNYLPAVHSLGYGVADLGACFALGVLLNPRWRGAAPAAPATACISALGIGLVATINTYSLAFFPDLIFSGSGAMQISPYLLVAGRFFPFWLLALVLGVLCAPLWRGSAGSLLAAAAGASATALLAGSSTVPCFLALALCFATVLTRLRRRPAMEGGRVLRPGSALLLVAAMVWATVTDPHGGWVGLQEALSATGGQGEAASGRGATVVGAQTNAWGAWVELQTGPEPGGGVARARFVNGGLVERSDTRRNVRPPATRLLMALALAHVQEGGEVAVVEPALRQTLEGVKALTGAEPRTVGPGGTGQAAQGGVVICGPGPFCDTGNPLKVLSVETLEGLRQQIGRDGVLALWFPVGWVEGGALRRGLATVSRVFPDFDVWLAGSEAVLVSGGEQMAFGRMQALFGDGATAEWLRRGGFWEPIDVLAAFVGPSDEMSGLWEQAPAYRLSRPVRPPVLARDLLARVRPENVAALAQHRLAGPARAVQRVRFASDKRRKVALRGFAAIYRGDTEQILRSLGRGDESGRSALVEFVAGPDARLELLAPDRQGRAARVAAALDAFGLTGRAIDILEEAVQGGEDSFEARMLLVEALTRARRPEDALRHCRHALEMRPGSVVAMRRLAALLMGAGRIREGADALEKVVEQNPGSVVDLLMLAELRARMGNLEEAADLARRVLELDPDNTDGQILLQLTQPGDRSARSLPGGRR